MGLCETLCAKRTCTFISLKSLQMDYSSLNPSSINFRVGGEGGGDQLESIVNSALILEIIPSVFFFIVLAFS